MYLHLGQDYIVKTRDIVAIFDIEKTSISQITKNFLRNASKKNNVIYVSDELPKSFIVVKNEKEEKIYISAISSATLAKRALHKNKGYLSL